MFFFNYKCQSNSSFEENTKPENSLVSTSGVLIKIVIISKGKSNKYYKVSPK
jgi:hypothetical protein